MASNNVFVLEDDHCEEEGNEAIDDGEEDGEMANSTSGIKSEQVLSPVSEEKQLKSDSFQETSSV